MVSLGPIATPPILELCHDLPRTVIGAGADVIEQGRKLGSLFILVEGAATVSRDGVVVAVLSEPGTVFGEMSTLLDQPATATVTATVDCTFLVARDGAAFLEQTPGATAEVARALAHRLELLTGYMADVSRQFAGRDGHLGLVGEVMRSLIHEQLPVVRPGSVRMPEVDY